MLCLAPRLTALTAEARRPRWRPARWAGPTDCGARRHPRAVPIVTRVIATPRDSSRASRGPPEASLVLSASLPRCVVLTTRTAPRLRVSAVRDRARLVPLSSLISYVGSWELRAPRLRQRDQDAHPADAWQPCGQHGCPADVVGRIQQVLDCHERRDPAGERSAAEHVEHRGTM